VTATASSSVINLRDYGSSDSDVIGPLHLNTNNNNDNNHQSVKSLLSSSHPYQQENDDFDIMASFATPSLGGDSFSSLLGNNHIPVIGLQQSELQSMLSGGGTNGLFSSSSVSRLAGISSSNSNTGGGDGPNNGSSQEDFAAGGSSNRNSQVPLNLDLFGGGGGGLQGSNDKEEEVDDDISLALGYSRQQLLKQQQPRQTIFKQQSAPSLGLGGSEPKQQQQHSRGDAHEQDVSKDLDTSASTSSLLLQQYDKFGALKLQIAPNPSNNSNNNLAGHNGGYGTNNNNNSNGNGNNSNSGVAALRNLAAGYSRSLDSPSAAAAAGGGGIGSCGIGSSGSSSGGGGYSTTARNTDTGLSIISNSGSNVGSVVVGSTTTSSSSTTTTGSFSNSRVADNFQRSNVRVNSLVAPLDFTSLKKSGGMNSSSSSSSSNNSAGRNTVLTPISPSNALFSTPYSPSDDQEGSGRRGGMPSFLLQELPTQQYSSSMGSIYGNNNNGYNFYTTTNNNNNNSNGGGGGNGNGTGSVSGNGFSAGRRNSPPGLSRSGANAVRTFATPPNRVDSAGDRSDSANSGQFELMADQIADLVLDGPRGVAKGEPLPYSSHHQQQQHQQQHQQQQSDSNSNQRTRDQLAEDLLLSSNNAGPYGYYSNFGGGGGGGGRE